MTALTVEKNTDLNFGTVVRPQTSQGIPYYATVRPDGSRNGDLGFAGGGATAATFAVSGQGDLTYAPTVTLAANASSLSDAGLNWGYGISAECDSLGEIDASASTLELSDCTLTNGASTVKVGSSIMVYPASDGPFTNGAVTLGTITVVVAYN